jgi:hypothetical protein
VKNRSPISPNNDSFARQRTTRRHTCLFLLLALLLCTVLPRYQRAETKTQVEMTTQVKGPTTNTTATKKQTTTAAQTVTLDFDTVDSSFGRLVASSYLNKFGITLKNVTEGTVVVIVDTRKEYEGHATVASSKPNALTQIPTNAPIIPVSFTMEFTTSVRSVGLTRPALLAGPTGVTYPEWSALALDSDGHQLDEVGEPLGGGADYYTNVPARRFILKGSSIKSVRFYSNNYHFAAFNAVLIDDLTLSQ